jgi:predicted dithiol-disulfide oxidoreductase (DUF899 family)
MSVESPTYDVRTHPVVSRDEWIEARKAHNFIDMTPKGRDEPGFPQQWVRRHDEYAF